ncbi:MAG: DUF4062 domain-containing protein [Steroidobacteraceae bacterium]
MTDRKEFVVYLSSTLADLEAEREIALKTIGQIGVVKTSYRGDEKGAVATCTADVRASHLYVGILGQRYGYVPPVGESNPDAKSITELEYQACLRPGQPPIPRLMFIKPTAAGIEDKHIDAIRNPQTAARMESFLDRANTDQTAFIFKTHEEFRAELRIRVGEQADRFHRADSGSRGMFGGSERWKRQLAPVAIACVPGTDGAQRAALGALGSGPFTAFELSPDDDAYLATLDAGLLRAQLGAFWITAASLARIKSSARVDYVTAGVDLMIERTGHAVLITEGVNPADLPEQWVRAKRFDVPAGVLTSADATASLGTLYEQLRTLDAALTLEPRLAIPYVIIAPTLEQVLALADPSEKALGGFADEDVRNVRRADFNRIATASRGMNPNWPNDLYGATPHEWKCFGAQSNSADRIIRDSVARMNSASPGSRERRFLRQAQLVPRRYRVEEYLHDRLGSRQAILAARDYGCLFLVDEVALLYPELRAAADALLVGARTAIVSITACDPMHSRIDKLLGDLSFLRVGSVVTRFKVELDPRCEIALNSMDRIERWLRATLPELVASADDQESVPGLDAKMAQVLAQ